MKKYGLIGYPLGHSFSRKFFTDKFNSEGIDAEYLNFEIPEATQLIDVISDNPELVGLNCTIPHKQVIIPLLNELSEEAQKIGAVNVIKIIRDNSKRGFYLKGFNSDIIGFMNSLRPLLKPHHKRALVLGTGGASKAICLGLEKFGIEWKYVSRAPKEGQLTYDDLNAETLGAYQVIVNCSPVGMHPHTDEAPMIPYSELTEKHLLYDLVYNPLKTKFLELGEKQGATTKNGLEMLHLQALASWEFWKN